MSMQYPAMAGPRPVSFALVDHHGRSVTDRTYLGRHAMLFFGFTRCELVCPRALSRLSLALDLLGGISRLVEPLYVTIDPDRDDVDALRTFLEPWPRFTGLTGGTTVVDRLRGAFRVFAERRGQRYGDYQISHSAFTHLLDPSGRHVDHWPDVLSPGEIADRLCVSLSKGGRGI
jgi:protein SCO1/2